jgi:hypothetical protein
MNAMVDLAPSNDLTGRQFGRLTVIRFIGYRTSPSGGRRPIYLCRCQCKTICEVSGHSLTRTSGTPTRSCGCLNRMQKSLLLRRQHGRRAGVERFVLEPDWDS